MTKQKYGRPINIADAYLIIISSPVSGEALR